MKKPFSFYMLVLLALLALITAWVATALAIALPVSKTFSGMPFYPF